MDRIVINPAILMGKPIIKARGFLFYLIIEFLANGLTEEEVLNEYPELNKADIKVALLLRFKMP
jgi:uncharacterized protein (DUF433 family)